MFDEKILQQGNKRKYVEIVLRVLKECRVLSAFKEYITTPQYSNHAKWYAQSFNTTKLWYDRIKYYDILGCCNFDAYLYVQKNGIPMQPYYLVLVYVAMFEPELYYLERPHGFEKDVQKYLNQIKNYLTQSSFAIVLKWEKILSVRKEMLK